MLAADVVAGAAAATEVSGSHGCIVANTPTKFDYMVLASIADTPHLLALAGYRSTARHRAASRTRNNSVSDSESAADGERAVGVQRP
ncbi:MAG: hypothetical protein ABJD53_04210 [Gammaproteobacteria bacterium]